jgi:catechol 2,3-dioxygenase-like lactoylglutathione lyase family enzyme
MRPRGLNHVAYVTWNTAETVRFYTELLGMRLIGHASGDQTSAGPSDRFLHTFFEMADGSCIAFFEIDGVDRETHVSPVPNWARHIALSVASLDELGAWEKHLRANNVEVLNRDHGTWTSIYFFDPNGIRLELTYQNRQLGDEDAAAATAALAEWNERRKPAAVR